jgi:ferredoxin
MSANRKLRMVIDKAKCSAYGLCADKSALLSLDKDGYSYLERDIVPEHLEASAREAVVACPMAAISIAEVTD